VIKPIFIKPKIKKTIKKDFFGFGSDKLTSKKKKKNIWGI